jgi:hypothetical protein
MVSRNKLLSNSAAEFVETRAEIIIEEISEEDDESKFNPPEFVSALDSFVPPGQAPK